MITWITVCDTCKDAAWRPESPETSGAVLAGLVEQAAQAAAHEVRVRRHSCLMGCARACNVTVQAEGKLSYTLAGFVPDAEAAAAIVEYAGKHAQCDTGQVPYREWPAGVKGHFAAKHVPLPGRDAAE